MQILIVKSSAIGDVTHTLPALMAIRRHFPESTITWLVEAASADVVLGHTALDRVLVCHRKSWMDAVRKGMWGKATRGFVNFVRELRDTHYDLVLDFQGLLKSSLWVVLAKGQRKVGFGRGMEHAECSYLFLNERIPAVDMNRHAIERGLILLERIGIPHDSVEYDFPITKESRQEAAVLLRENQVTERDCVITIHPMTRWPTKLWEHQRFGEVADRLMGLGKRIVITGSIQDREAIDTICRHMTHQPIRLDGKTSLKTLAAIYQQSQVLVTTDNGPMHIAAAMGTPVVALFGPTAPWRTGPYGQQHTVLRKEIPCSPCFKKQCLTKDVEEQACLRRITVEEVVAAVLQKVDLPFPQSAFP